MAKKNNLWWIIRTLKLGFWEIQLDIIFLQTNEPTLAIDGCVSDCQNRINKLGSEKYKFPVDDK